MIALPEHCAAEYQTLRLRIARLVTAKGFAVVAAVTTTGAAVRVFHLGAQSLWLDELFSVFLARRDWSAIVTGTALDQEPPLYYFLLHLALQWNAGEMAARLVSVVFAIATIPLLFALARAMFDDRTAVASTIILSLSPFQVSFAQEARMYAQLTFFTLVALYGFVQAWRGGLLEGWVLFSVGTSLALYTHNLAILNLVAVDVFAALDSERRRIRLRGLFIANACIIVLFSPWLAVLPQQIVGVYGGYWEAPASLIGLVSTPVLFVFGNSLSLLAAPPALFSVTGLLAFGLMDAARGIVKDKRERLSLGLCLSVFFIPVTLLFAVSLMRPVWVPRTIIPASLGLYLLLGWGVAHARPRALNVVFGAAAIVSMVLGLMNYYSDPLVQKPAMREAAQALASVYRQGDAVAHTSDSSALGFMYYAPNLPNEFLKGDPDYENQTSRGRGGEIAGLVPVDWDTIAAGHHRLWLVVALDHNVDYQRVQVEEAAGRFSPGAVQNVSGIYLMLFTQP